LWYELIAAGSELAADMDVPVWLLAVAEDEVAYGEAMGLLSRYSLAEDMEGTDNHSMYAVLHRWCGYMAEDEERQELGCLAVGLVALSVPLESDAEFLKKRKRVMAHGICVSGRIGVGSGLDKQKAFGMLLKPGRFHSLRHLLADEDRQRAVQMYERALQGREKAWGAEHASTLSIDNHLGILYADLGRLDEAEKMYERALNGYSKAISPRHLGTYVPALNNMWAFASLCEDQGRIDDARDWYSQALLGYQKPFGQDHEKCETLRKQLASLVANSASTEDSFSRMDIAEAVASSSKPAFYRQRLLTRLRRKRR
jgi:tetratricopeptide (TPR) repeat protein